MIALGALRLDFGRPSVFVRGREVPLRAKELALLALLARHAGRTVPHAQLLRHVWGPDHPDDAAGRRTMMVHVRWLREKREADPGHPRLLVTEPAVG